MRTSLAAIGSLFAFAFTLAALPGCADDTASSKQKKDDPFAEAMPPVLTKEAVNADQSFANDVVVKEDRLEIVTAGHEKMIAKISEGSILAGNRSAMTVTESDTGNYGTNPYGFLRHVTKIQTEGANTVFLTKKATLDEWLQQGDIDFSDRQSLLDGATPIADDSFDAKTKTYGRSLKFLAEGQGAGGGSGAVAINAQLGERGAGVKLSNATFNLNARFDGHFRVRYKELRFLPDPPTGVNFKSHLTLDPLVTADIEISTSRAIALAEQSWRGRGVLIPIAAPIPVTLRFEPEVKCAINVGGQIAVTVGARIGAHAEAGFQGDAGFTHFDIENLGQTPRINGGLELKSVTGKATLQVECKLLAVPVLLAFDAAGIEGKVGPYVQLNADVCSALSPAGPQGDNAGFTLSEEHGLAGEFSGRIQIPLLGTGRSFELASVAVPLTQPNYIIGNAQSCDVRQVDSCQGKTDGFHCSEVAAYSGIVCEGGQILKGIQCAEMSQRCTGGTTDTIQCQ